MENKGVENVLNASNKSKERIFPILNKLDRFWSSNSELTFCDIIKKLELQNIKNDLELTKKLDECIDGQKIK